MSGPLFVVGDRFATFAKNADAVAVSELLARLSEGDAAVDAPLARGQGLRDDQVAHLSTLAAEKGCDLRRFDRSVARADARATHKAVPQNILVSTPRRIDATRFEAELLVDDRAEVISDHMTGQHIQGMALVEAARQMWTAVAETYLLDGRAGTFVLDTVAARFQQFVFPLPTRITQEIVVDAASPLERRLTMRVAFHQAGREAAVVDASVRVVDARLMAKQESIAAKRTLQSCAQALSDGAARGAEP